MFIPKNIAVRPTFSRLKQTLFDICQFSIENATFLDLFAGVGGMGLEALSRNAVHVTFVEEDREALLALKKNIATLNEEVHTKVIGCDVFEALMRLEKQGQQFDIIFADPPYGTKERSLSNKVLTYIDEHALLKSGGMLFLEDDAQASTTPALKHLHLISERKISRAVLRQFLSG